MSIVAGIDVAGMKLLEHDSTIATYNNGCDMLFIQLLKSVLLCLYLNKYLV